MIRALALSALSLLFVAGSAGAAEITGKYVEARTCDIWTGPCFANADFNLSGKHAVLAWKVDKGTFQNVKLDGLGVVAVLVANNTLGLKQPGPAKVIFIVDKGASAAQQKALVGLAQQQTGGLLDNVVAVHSAEVQVNFCDCKGNACAEVVAGKAVIKTRCLNTVHDKVCGNESAYYPPLAQGVQAIPAAAEEQGYTGTGLNQTWHQYDNRGAYVGSFKVH
jgi:hypothetical protein